MSTARSRCGAARPQPVGRRRHPHAHLAQLHHDDLEVLGPDADELDLAARDPARHQQRAGLDAVAHDRGVGGARALRRPRSRSSTTLRRRPARPSGRGTRARSVTSGSRAAFSMTVVPFASTAAHIRFSVAPTLGNSSTTRAPCSSSARASHVAVLDLDLGAHRFETAKVHVDLAAPDVVAARERDAARPQRASSGPSTLNDARIRVTSSYGTSGTSSPDASTRTTPGSGCSTCAPAARSSSTMTSRSRTDGMLRSVVDAGREQRGGHLLQPGVLRRARHVHDTLERRARAHPEPRHAEKGYLPE